MDFVRPLSGTILDACNQPGRHARLRSATGSNKRIADLNNGTLGGGFQSLAPLMVDFTPE